MPEAVHQEDEVLLSALEQCRNAAREGATIARQNLDRCRAALRQSEEQIGDICRELHTRSSATEEIRSALTAQLERIRSKLEELVATETENLSRLESQLDHFNIVLFGRTKAGKSTLMEILTNGSGESIGKGGQRTTRDVRHYTWSGLRVTDVPGVAAFEGKVDEDVAYEAATTADLCLFLFSDDAPQPVEAEHLARVRKLGKPVISVLNVKFDLGDRDTEVLHDPIKLKLFFKQAPEKLNDARAGRFSKQLGDLVRKYLPESGPVKLTPVMLRARYLAARSGYQEYRSRLLESSRFGELESELKAVVRRDGRQLRYRTFIEVALGPMLATSEELLDFADANSRSGRLMKQKLDQFRGWQASFEESARKRLRHEVAQQVSRLRNDIRDFVDTHCEDEKASAKWGEKVEKAGIARRLSAVQRELVGEAERELREFSRQLEAESSIVAGLTAYQGQGGYWEPRFKTEGFFDGKKAFRWGVILVGGIVSIAGLFAPPLAPVLVPLGILISTVGNLITGLLEGRDKLLEKARKRLTRALEDHLDEIERRYVHALEAWLKRDLLGAIHGVRSGWQTVLSSLFKLADSQRDLAWSLNETCIELNYRLVQRLLADAGHPEAMSLIQRVARVPGQATLLAFHPGAIMPDGTLGALRRHLGEQIVIITATGRLEGQIGRILGKGPDGRPPRVSLEERIRVAHVELDHVTEAIRTRLRLAQQYSERHLVCQRERQVPRS